MPNTIVLVDDDRNILTSVTMALEDEGFKVCAYAGGAEALEGLERQPVDLAVLDIKMPRMDGMELLRKIREKSDMPVIFLTSKDDEIDEMLGLRMGADDYIKKPFSQRLLIERIRALLRRRDLAAKNTGEAEDKDVLRRGDLVLDPARHLCAWRDRELNVTVTEFLLLQALARRPGHVKSRDQLIDAAYGRAHLRGRPDRRQPRQALAQEVQGSRSRVRAHRDALRRRLPLPRRVMRSGEVWRQGHITEEKGAPYLPSLGVSWPSTSWRWPSWSPGCFILVSTGGA